MGIKHSTLSASVPKDPHLAHLTLDIESLLGPSNVLSLRQVYNQITSSSPTMSRTPRLPATNDVKHVLTCLPDETANHLAAMLASYAFLSTHHSAIPNYISAHPAHPTSPGTLNRSLRGSPTTLHFISQHKLPFSRPAPKSRHDRHQRHSPITYTTLAVAVAHLVLGLDIPGLPLHSPPKSMPFRYPAVQSRSIHASSSPTTLDPAYLPDHVLYAQIVELALVTAHTSSLDRGGIHHFLGHPCNINQVMLVLALSVQLWDAVAYTNDSDDCLTMNVNTLAVDHDQVSPSLRVHYNCPSLTSAPSITGVKSTKTNDLSPTLSSNRLDSTGLGRNVAVTSGSSTGCSRDLVQSEGEPPSLFSQSESRTLSGYWEGIHQVSSSNPNIPPSYEDNDHFETSAYITPLPLSVQSSFIDSVEDNQCYTILDHELRRLPSPVPVISLNGPVGNQSVTSTDGPTQHRPASMISTTAVFNFRMSDLDDAVNVHASQYGDGSQQREPMDQMSVRGGVISSSLTAPTISLIGSHESKSRYLWPKVKKAVTEHHSLTGIPGSQLQTLAERLMELGSVLSVKGKSHIPDTVTWESMLYHVLVFLIPKLWHISLDPYLMTRLLARHLTTRDQCRSMGSNVLLLASESASFFDSSKSSSLTASIVFSSSGMSDTSNPFLHWLLEAMYAPRCSLNGMVSKSWPTVVYRTTTHGWSNDEVQSSVDAHLKSGARVLVLIALALPIGTEVLILVVSMGEPKVTLESVDVAVVNPITLLQRVSVPMTHGESSLSVINVLNIPHLLSADLSTRQANLCLVTQLSEAHFGGPVGKTSGNLGFVLPSALGTECSVVLPILDLEVLVWAFKNAQ